MKKFSFIVFILLVLIITGSGFAEAQISPCGTVKAGSTDVSCSVTMRATADGVGVTGLDETTLTVSFYREGEASTTGVTEVALTALNDAHTDGGVLEIDSTNQPGEYLVHFPDTAFATGSDWVTISATAAASYAYRRTLPLPDYSLNDIFASDGIAQSATGTSIKLAASASSTDDIYNDNMIAIVSGTGSGQSRCIDDYDGTSKDATVEAWVTNPDNTSEYKLSAGCGSGSSTVTGTVDANIVEVNGNAVTTISDLKADTSGLSTYDPNVDTVTVGSLPEAAIPSTTANKLADYVLRRNASSVESSADGDSIVFPSLLGAVMKQTGRISVDGGNLKTYRTDGTTELGSQSVTTDSSAAPITGLN